MPRIPAWILIILCVGCAPAKSPQTVAAENDLRARAAAVRLTNNPADVRGCREIGYVQSKPAQSVYVVGEGNIWVDYPRNVAAQMGANVLFTTDGANGSAYDCSVR